MKREDSALRTFAVAVVYLAMLLLVLVFFSGNGEFIYEAF